MHCDSSVHFHHDCAVRKIGFSGRWEYGRVIDVVYINGGGGWVTVPFGGQTEWECGFRTDDLKRERKKCEIVKIPTMNNIEKQIVK